MNTKKNFNMGPVNTPPENLESLVQQYETLEKEKARILAQYKKYLDAVVTKKQSHA